ncbi:hypothetical protein O1611_g167 [Lasiodiplodia mahajangana]|uniref:Uncharacterized protein n=1 Tax=Lasiodiplodia mahajangana TaxID=1108764 RepID=A0ACC2K1K2_9PEZI|nr:hypothetical protein O1611_g167 [Lasiodiplodia mahajangana]
MAEGSSGGLGVSDIIGIAVGVPSAILALIGVIIAYLTLRKKDNLKSAKRKLISLGDDGLRLLNIRGPKGLSSTGNEEEEILMQSTHRLLDRRDQAAPRTRRKMLSAGFRPERSAAAVKPSVTVAGC